MGLHPCPLQVSRESRKKLNHGMTKRSFITCRLNDASENPNGKAMTMGKRLLAALCFSAFSYQSHGNIKIKIFVISPHMMYFQNIQLNRLKERQ